MSWGARELELGLPFALGARGRRRSGTQRDAAGLDPPRPALGLGSARAEGGRGVALGPGPRAAKSTSALPEPVARSPAHSGSAQAACEASTRLSPRRAAPAPPRAPRAGTSDPTAWLCVPACLAAAERLGGVEAIAEHNHALVRLKGAGGSSLMLYRRSKRHTPRSVVQMLARLAWVMSHVGFCSLHFRAARTRAETATRAMLLRRCWQVRRAAELLRERWDVREPALGARADGSGTAGLAAVRLPEPLFLPSDDSGAEFSNRSPHTGGSDGGGGGGAAAVDDGVAAAAAAKEEETCGSGGHGHGAEVARTPDGAQLLQRHLRQRWRIEVPVACVAGALYCRISAQVTAPGAPPRAAERPPGAGRGGGVRVREAAGGRPLGGCVRRTQPGATCGWAALHAPNHDHPAPSIHPVDMPASRPPGVLKVGLRCVQTFCGMPQAIGPAPNPTCPPRPRPNRCTTRSSSTSGWRKLWSSCGAAAHDRARGARNRA